MKKTKRETLLGMSGANTATEEDLIAKKETRDLYIDRIEVLTKVKNLFLIPALEMATTSQVANAFKVSPSAIRMIVASNRDELESDGMVVKGRKEIESLLSNQLTVEKYQRTSVICYGEHSVKISNAKAIYFPQRAILRIAMLLRDSEIAKEVRTALLGTFYAATPAQRLDRLDQELLLQAERIMARQRKDYVRVDEIDDELMAMKNEHIKAAEDEVERLERENDLLAQNLCTTEPKALLNAMVRAVASRTTKDFAYAWRWYYKKLRYRFGISLASRASPTGKQIDAIRDDEWPMCIAVAAGMVRRDAKMTLSDVLTSDDVQQVKDMEKDVYENNQGKTEEIA